MNPMRVDESPGACPACGGGEDSYLDERVSTPAVAYRCRECGNTRGWGLNTDPATLTEIWDDSLVIGIFYDGETGEIRGQASDT